MSILDYFEFGIFDEILLALEVLTQLTPSVHGLYRAITSMLFPWTMTQWQLLSHALASLVQDPILECINQFLLDIHEEAEESPDPKTFFFCHAFITRYINFGRPLSGYFIVCCVMELQWTVLAQALVTVSAEGIRYRGPLKEAAAANKAWLSLMKRAAKKLPLEDGATKDALRSTTRGSLQCFKDLLVQIQDMDTEPHIDTYAWETMSESLVRLILSKNVNDLILPRRNWRLYVPLPWESLILTFMPVLVCC